VTKPVLLQLNIMHCILPVSDVVIVILCNLDLNSFCDTIVIYYADIMLSWLGILNCYT